MKIRIQKYKLKRKVIHSHIAFVSFQGALIHI